MDYKNVNQLLEKYWEGETSLQEEATLRQYFNNGSIAQEHLPYQPLFQFFAEEQAEMVGDDFENKLLEKLELANTEVSAPSQSGRIIRFDFYKNVKRIAAVAAIFLGAFFIIKNIGITQEEDRFAQYDAEDEQEAYERTKAALALISNKMNRGSDKAEKGLEGIRKGTKAIK